MIAKIIADQYIMEGIRLRKTYIENLKQILVQEPIIYEKKKSFDNLKDEMEGIVKSDLNEIMKTIELNNKLNTLEKELRKIQDIIRPIYEKIETLKIERDRLYLSIKEKYPNVTNEEIESEIMKNVEE
jgi:predicted transcriptional regulator